LLPFNLAVRAAAGPFLFALLVSLALVPLARRAAVALGCVAHPRDDRWHRRPIALFGGVAIGATVLLGILAFGVLDGMAVPLACAALIFVMGLTDDIVSLRPSTKLVIEVAIACAFLTTQFRLNWVSSLTLDMMLTLVWIVGMTNAFNLLDNMDGLCAGIALIVGGALMVNLAAGLPSTAVVPQIRYLALLLGATAGFLVYNFHPATIFMGDSGSLTLGLSFAALTLSSSQQVAAKSNPLSIVAVPLLVLLIPIFDTSLVTASRILSGRAPSEGGRDHSSHRLVAVGLSERAAVAVLWLLAAIGGAVGIAFDFFNLSWSGLVASLFIVAMVIFAAYLSRVRVYEESETDVLDRARITPLVADFLYKRRVAEVLLDIVLVTVAYYTAYRLRFESGRDYRENFTLFYQSLPLLVGIQMVTLFAAGVYRGVWRYFGLMDTVTIAKGVAVGTAASVLTLLMVLRFEHYSRTVFVIYGIVLTMLLIVARASFRLIAEWLRRNHKATTRVIVYGAGDGGLIAVRELGKASERYRILGLVDDDANKRKVRVHGYPVLGGLGALEAFVVGHSVDAVVISARMLDAERRTRLESLCAHHGVPLLRLHVGLETVGAAATGA
jgi:UDP-GlcNAc:undecaprenyl-phosphate GlcNAc-1-phosphate transferase